MKILALNLSSENVSAFPSGYGGFGPSLHLLAKNLNNITVLGTEESFRGSDLKNRLIVTQEEIDRIIRWGRVPAGNWDLVFHSHTILHIQDIPSLVWASGDYEKINPANHNLLLHNKFTQNPQIFNPNTRIFEFTLGISLPKFIEYPKESFIFQCSNHYPAIQSHVLAQICNSYGIHCVFAGPCHDKDYREMFLKRINNQNTFYLGEISEQLKIEYLKKACFVAGLYAHNINSLPLAFKQALSYGCGIITTKVPAMVEKIKNGYNGFFISDPQDLSQIMLERFAIKQENCYNSALEYSEERMVESFKNVLAQL